MANFQDFLPQLILLLIIGSNVNGLSAPPRDTANIARLQLQQSLSSISNKLTLSPEIIIPEPTDPTALLLQSTEVTKMSYDIRAKAKSNAVFLSGSLNSINTFCTEQETARGNFPGPLPVIYCESSYGDDCDMSQISEAGAIGYLYTLSQGKEVTSVEDVKNDDCLKSYYENALKHGMQLIPEILLSSDINWKETDITPIVNELIELCGSDPAAILISIGGTPRDVISDENDSKESDCDIILPLIDKNLSKKIPILGSVRAVAGDGRMGVSVNNHKDAGFKGCVLRCDCLPGYRMNPDLEFVGGFWGAAIGDLKSTKSKSFNFRSTIALDRDIPMEWYKYQKNVMDSGALGSPSSAGTDPLDTDNGDYKGF